MSEGNEFVDQFIDDYFSECEEHLTTVRRILLAIDQGSGDSAGTEQFQELSRALHTLKGLSGMVGLGAAEEVAHAMEDGVRAVPRDDRIPAELLEMLFSGESLLESCIESRRAHSPPPSPGPYVDRMRDVIHASNTAAATNVLRGERVAVEPVGGDVVRNFEFTPSSDLVNRGIGVEVIRQRLMSIGSILTTFPRVRATGGLTFEFAVAIRAGFSPDESWRSEGVSWEPWEEVQSAQPVGMVVHAPRPQSEQRVVAATASNVVRVDLARLDDLMRMVGELVVSRARLGELIAQTSDTLPSSMWDDLNDANEGLERQLRTIREGVTRVRLVAVNEVFERMRFAMRDIARETQKVIHLEFQGQDTEIDKLVVDRMLEPMLHLVRNSASHGIESRDDRLAAGKPAHGTSWLRARAAGDRIVIEVEDDGAGIDARAVTRRAKEMGLVATTEPLAPDALLDVICSSGFSTRSTADMASGRGVGMAVVRSTIRGLGGELFFDSAAGHGTRFTIELPLTLMITDALILEIGDQAMAIPQIALREIVPLDPAQVTHMENNDVLSYRGKVIPLVNLGAMFNLAPRPGASRHVLIVGNNAQLAGLVVDRLLGLREIVVHPVTDPMIAVTGIAGATELADGRVSLILDAAALLRAARDRRVRQPPAQLHSPARDASRSVVHASPVPEHLWS
jgi:two-component system chemotaxis sensor kinase CheA